MHLVWRSSRIGAGAKHRGGGFERVPDRDDGGEVAEAEDAWHETFAACHGHLHADADAGGKT